MDAFDKNPLKDHSYYMTLAYEEALKASEVDEVPIGAIIVYKNEVIAKAHNRVEHSKDPTAHAEILAIQEAAAKIGDWRLTGCTLYVTKEPCPMCSGATLMARLDAVVYAVKDPKMGCLGGATDINQLPKINHHLEVHSGILEEACHALLKTFFQKKRSKA